MLRPAGRERPDERFRGFGYGAAPLHPPFAATEKQSGRWARIAQIAQEYRRMLKVKEDNEPVDAEEVGRLIALAYPERIAWQSIISAISECRTARRSSSIQAMQCRRSNGSPSPRSMYLPSRRARMLPPRFHLQERQAGCFSRLP